MNEKLHTLYSDVINMEVDWNWRWLVARNPNLIPTADDFDTFEDFEKCGGMFLTPPLKKGTDIATK